MIYEINVTQFRKEIGHYLNEVKYGHNSFIIKRGMKRWAL
jgi:antitoxin (DNA-binding transcriptional repressor) of toxin-antitoxin stability system